MTETVTSHDLTTTKANFVEEAQNRGDLFIHQPYELNERLPWDHVNVKYGRTFLEKEQNRAMVQLATMADAQ